MFFTDFHLELIHTIEELLNDNNESSSIIIAPKRGNSMDLFLEKCNNSFEISYLFPGKNLEEKMKQLEIQEDYKANSDFLYYIELKKKKFHIKK